MKKLFPLILLALLTYEMDAQQLSRRTQFIFDTYLVNPGAAGTQLETPIVATYRQQWAGFDHAPVTFTLSGHTSLPNKIGIGGILYHDDTGGAISRTGAELTGTYHVDLNNQDAVSFGLSALVHQFSFDNSILEVYDANDLALINSAESTLNLDASFGLMVYGRDYYFGFSIPQLIQTKLGIEGLNEELNQNARHFNFMGAYLYYFNNDFSIQPSALAKFTASSPVQLDVYMKGIYQDFVWTAIGYRHKDAITFSAGMEYLEYAFAYSYDLTTSNAGQAFSPHTHEISVGYYIRRKGAVFTEKSLLGRRVIQRRRVVR